MIDQKGGDDSTASVDLAKLSVDAYGALHSSSDPISSVYDGGAGPPRPTQARLAGTLPALAGCYGGGSRG